MSRKSVQAAYCPQNGYGSNACVLQKSECPFNNGFYSSREMQNSPNIAHGGICLHSLTVKEKPMGSCADGTCSPNEASCGELGYHSVKDAETCLVQNTSFGRCGDRCSWSPDDCVGDNWSFPSQGCSCDQVEVGACEKDGFVYCAVSPDSCDDRSIWLSHDEVEFTTDYRCYLCRENIKPSDSVAKNSADADSSIDSVATNSADMDPSINDRTEVSSERSTSAPGAVIGGIIGGIVGVTMVMILVLFVRKRQAQKAKNVNKAPMKTFDVETDNVSVL